MHVFITEIHEQLFMYPIHRILNSHTWR